MKRSVALASLVMACSSAPEERPAPVAVRKEASLPAKAPEVPAAPPVPEDPLALLDPRASTSIGSVTNGRLEGGVALPLRGPGYRFNERRDAGARYATVEVIRAIARAAEAVERELPGSELYVNDVGLLGGGKIPHHGSHRAGRDADILFYMLGDDEKPTRAVGTPLDYDLVGYDFKELDRPEDDVRVHLDAPRTWRFVSALMSDPDARVQRIFVVEHVRTALLREAERVHADAHVVARFSDVSCQPGYPHDDHLHVRWFCSPEDIAQGCEELPPVYPWHHAELLALGTKVVMADRARSVEPAKVTTQAEADRAIARKKPHPSVLAFMKKRKAWEKLPHPGRPYCR